MMLSLHCGGCNVLIPNPRDIPALLKELKANRFHLFPAVNTLFGAIARHEGAKAVDWSRLKLSVGGGMAVQKATADLWKSVTAVRSARATACRRPRRWPAPIRFSPRTIPA